MNGDLLDGARLRKVIAAARLLESDKPGEVQAGLEGMRRLLKPAGLTVADFLQGRHSPAAHQRPTRPSAAHYGPMPRTFEHVLMRDHQRKAKWLTLRLEALNAKERRFVEEMAAQRATPTHAQLAWLDRLNLRLSGEEGA